MIAFSVSRLEKEPIRLEGSEPAEFLILAGSEPFVIASPMDYALDVEHVSGGALVSGHCGVTIEGECGRCLAPVSKRIETGNFKCFVETPHGMEVCDISEDIRTEMTLALPMNLLCRDDCRGLCPVCGENLNRKRCSCHPEKAAPPSSVWSALDDLKL